MLLKDCPVGSVVECIKKGLWEAIPLSLKGSRIVELDVNGMKYVTDDDGHKWFGYEDSDDDYIIISYPNSSTPSVPKQINLKGKTYKLTPVPQRDIIEIDGVEYYMEPV